MKKMTGLMVFAMCLLTIAWVPLTDIAPDLLVRNYVVKEMEACQQQLLLAQKTKDKEVLKSIYRKAREHYKHVEFFVAYISPREVKYAINGPLVFKYDPDWSYDIELQGFQKIEELLYGVEAGNLIEVQKLYDHLSVQMERLLRYYGTLKLAPADALEMQQLQLYRIVALNLNGYDATFIKNNTEECIWNLEGMEQAMVCYSHISDGKAYREATKQLNLAKSFLTSHQDWDQFPRLEFIVQCINPLNTAIVNFHNACELPWSKRKQALNLNQKFLFGTESFNLQFFSIYFDDTLRTSKQVALGKILFFDPLLSGNNSRSCASCHHPDLSFTDGLPKARHVDEDKSLQRNTPTLWNVALQQSFFYDGRASQLEQQVFEVIHSKEEMNADLSQIAEKLKGSATYRKLFREAFVGTADSSLTPYSIQKALSEFEKTLLSLNSPFDHYIRGDRKAMKEREVNGYTIFAGKALCGSCHFFPLFNGTVPPAFNDTEFEVIGVPETIEESALDPDQGRFKVFKVDKLKFAFKTPGLRNVARTAPYMHNGVYTSLEQVVEFYHRGGGQGLGLAVEHQTLPFDSLQLSPKEKEDIALFLKTLDDPSAHINQPVALPAFEKRTEWNNRKIGGSY